MALHPQHNEGVFEEAGVEATQSRSSGIMTDERLQRVQDWIVKDMRGVLAPMWTEVVRSLDRVTIREQVSPELPSPHLT